MNRTIASAVALAVLAALSASVLAGNVDLVTLPSRDTVQLTIYNSEDLTLVRETRNITVKKGLNKLQFSWANTLIDPSSVTFRPLEHQDEVELLDTVFPGQKPQHLIWNVQSGFEGQVAVEVTYFTSGLTWSMDYAAIVDQAEEQMQFTGYVRVFNHSGEEYDNAEIRLIVGTINLVEKIEELARRRGIDVIGDKSSLVFSDMKKEVARCSFALAMPESRPSDQPTKIIKEGLSEYFMFSVGGTETIPNGWSKRMRAVEAKDVSFDIVYRMRGRQYGPRPVRFFTWRNDEKHKLGESPLPDGQVNLFRQNGADGLAFLARQQIRYVPVKAAIEINLGPDELVVYETRRMSSERMNFHFRLVNNRQVVDGWDERTGWVDTIRNYRTRPIVFELRRQWDGDSDYDSEVKTTLFDYRTTVTEFEIAPRSKRQYPATITVHMGRNKRQNRVRIAQAG